MDCSAIDCLRYDSDFGCSVYYPRGQAFRIRIGYCPIPDKYFDTERQEAYERSNGATGKGRVGQQKQKKHR